MPEPGYLYLLINASMQGLVKIGRTTRDPDERARELSAATGVPTPFVLVFDAYFQDCVRAEEYVHTLLESKSYRISKNREFFVAPVKEAIRAVIAAEKLLGSAETHEEGHNPIARADSSADEPWQGVLDLADATYYGLAGTLQDALEGLRLYLLAAKLGSSQAHVKAGNIYRDRGDMAQAMIHFKEAVRLGITHCHADMASIFGAAGHAKNCKLCWDNYLASDASRSGIDRGRYGLLYMSHARKFRFVIDRQFITDIKDALLTEGEMRIERFKREGHSIAMYQAQLEDAYVRYALYGDDGVLSLHGEIRYFNPGYGGGILVDEIVDKDNLVHFSADDIVLESFAQPTKLEGQRVLCQVVGEGFSTSVDLPKPSVPRGLQPNDLTAFNVRAVPLRPHPEALGRV